nr:DUF5336 domain-containing protein [Gordonia sp. LAM0048]
MNPGEPQHPGGQWSGVPHGPPQTGGFAGNQDQTAHVQHPGTGGVPGQQWNTGAQYPPPGWGQPPRGPRADLSVIFALASALAGIVTYFMGFLSWVSVSAGAEEELNRWGADFEEGQGGIPAFFSYEIVLNPGKFFIALGVVGIAATFVLVPRYRRALPFLAVVGVAAWLALFAAALITPPFLDLGAGAIVGLILGFLQVALLVAAAFLYGLKKDDAHLS